MDVSVANMAKRDTAVTRWLSYCTRYVRPAWQYDPVRIYRLAFFLLCLIAPAAFGSDSIVAQYVRIELPGDERILSLAEVQVYSGKKLISLSGQAKTGNDVPRGDGRESH